MPTPAPEHTATDASPAPTALDVRACRRLLQGNARSFHAASLLLPRRVRDGACALYAFCRVADDAVDVEHGGAQAVAQLRARLDAVYSGRPAPNVADRALAHVVATHPIARPLFDALIEGFAWDAEGRCYDTEDDLLDYAARVAGSVGAMMAALMGVRSAEAVARACDLGVAMQLSNIARDVAEDARIGRLYLPLQWLRDAGIDPQAWRAAPVFDTRLLGVVRRLLQTAEALYARADAGIALLPAACRPGIRAARSLYREIGREVQRRGVAGLNGRVVVPRQRQLALLAAAVAQGRAPNVGNAPLPATRFLVDAALQHGAWSARRAGSVGARLLGLLDLFERLERRDRAARASLNGRALG